MPGVEGQLCIDTGGAQPKALQEQSQAEARLDGVDEQQYFALHQVELQQRHHHQQLVVPASKSQNADKIYPKAALWAKSGQAQARKWQLASFQGLGICS